MPDNRELLPVALVDAGLVLFGFAAGTLLWPSRIRRRARPGALPLLLTSAASMSIGLTWPVNEVHIRQQHNLLDQFAPVFQFNEAHRVQVNASVGRVYEALRTVSADEISLYRSLTWIRRMGRSGPESILNPPMGVPLLEVATRTGFIQLAEDPGREIVIGRALMAPPTVDKSKLTPQTFLTLRESGCVLASMNFEVKQLAPGRCLLVTETRVYATDAVASRKFAAYWRIIYPGSALIRRMWLRAIKRRAESQL